MSQKWDSSTWSPGSDGRHLLGCPSSTQDHHCRGAQTSKREKKWGGKRVSKETRQGRRRDQKNRATDETNRVREKKRRWGWGRRQQEKNQPTYARNRADKLWRSASPAPKLTTPASQCSYLTVLLLPIHIHISSGNNHGPTRIQ